MDYNSAYERVTQLKKFYKSLLWFGIVAGIIFLMTFLKTDHLISLYLMDLLFWSFGEFF
ncbi:hypothetical protein EG345_22535 [Chryseobacterium carnipullorum]|uniref:2TM domain-containing protein n=1 Tax=Chryseobacterium carnipullorum TaxID=1124835 RepID=UPI000F5096E8|nr:hypothetical protein EG345_22535 [Chryseobacterium carnipullorum]